MALSVFTHIRCVASVANSLRKPKVDAIAPTATFSSHPLIVPLKQNKVNGDMDLQIINSVEHGRVLDDS